MEERMKEGTREEKTKSQTILFQGTLYTGVIPLI